MPALLFLRARLERLGTLHQLKYWWSDRCCDGAKDVTKHVLTTIFPSITRPPYRDLFHAIQVVNKSCHEGLPEQKSKLGASMFNALQTIPESELTPVIAWLKKSRGCALLTTRLAFPRPLNPCLHHLAIGSTKRRRAPSRSRTSASTASSATSRTV